MFFFCCESRAIISGKPSNQFRFQASSDEDIPKRILSRLTVEREQLNAACHSNFVLKSHVLMITASRRMAMISSAIVNK